jgi:ankyrin repeat protein
MIASLQKHLQDKNIKESQALLRANPAVLEAQAENGSSGFILVAYSGSPELLQIAIELKSSFNLPEAVVSGQESEVERLLAQDKSQVNDFATDGFTPIALAAFFNQPELVRLLLQAGADPNLSARNPSKVNALHAAVAKEQLEICTLLLENGADPNAAQMQHVQALHSAVHRNNLALVQLLVEGGADVKGVMDNGDTPMLIAKREGHQEVLNYLQQQS